MVTPTPQTNPLTKYMRQPKIYITLPSKGKFWTQGSIDIPENEQLPVYSMTAKDELLFKTPDALMNGQAVVDVIQSCIPSIKNAWATPSIDLDMILVAIRIATYGNKMPIKCKVPVIDEENEYEVDLHQFIDQTSKIKWEEQIPFEDNLVIFVRPLTYKNMTVISQKGFETNKILQIANDDRYTETQKADMIRETFKTLTEITTDMIVNSISKIKTPEGDATETRFIKAYIDNADQSVIKQIQSHIEELKKVNSFEPVTFNTTEDERERGAPETFSVPVNFDNSSFFA